MFPPADIIYFSSLLFVCLHACPLTNTKLTKNVETGAPTLNTNLNSLVNKPPREIEINANNIARV